MKITVYPPQGFSIQGKRDYNEDYLYPELDASSFGGLFLVCDGVGGSSRGEVASQLACSCFAQLLEPDLQKESLQLDALHMKHLLEATEQQLSDYVKEHPEAEGMATTLTLLAFHEGGATVGHIGDSRVYQFREGEIIFQTKDHSFVQELLDDGLIDEERAKVHPKRNVISRALQGTAKPTKISTSILTDIQAEDYFLLCSDGVLEAWANEDLEALIAESEDAEELSALLLEGCQERSKDNATAYVVQVESAEGKAADWAIAAAGVSEAVFEEDVPVLEEDNEAEDIFAETDEEIASSAQPTRESESNNKLLLPILLLGVLVLALFWWQPWATAKAKPEKATAVPPAVSTTPPPEKRPSTEDKQVKRDSNRTKENSEKGDTPKDEKK